MSPFFEATNITKARPDGSALFRNVCISLERGDVLTLRGPSGVGYVSVIEILYTQEILLRRTSKLSLSILFCSLEKRHY